MAATLSKCASLQAINMELGRWKGSAEVVAEIGAALGAQPEWTSATVTQIGTYLLHRLVKVASLPTQPRDASDAAWGPSWDSAPAPGEEEAGGEAGVEAGVVPAFFIDLEYVSSKKTVKYLRASPELEGLMTPLLMSPSVLSDRQRIHPAEFPMLVPPVAWSKSADGDSVGGCFHHGTKLVRTSFVDCKKRLRPLEGELQPLFDALNSLAATEWRINRPMLALAQRLFDITECPEELRRAVSFMPDRVDRDAPPAAEEVQAVEQLITLGKKKAGGYQAAKERFAAEDMEAWAEWRHASSDVKVHNANLHSQKCTARLQLDVAESLKERGFFFPYNVDFRGRAYPVSPYLSHIGDDLCRGLLLFGEARPLGASGYRWLKIHLANLYGMDKLPLQRREAWADVAIASGILAEVAADPLGPTAVTWWREADSTLQAIAVATELHAASTHRPEGEQGPLCPSSSTWPSQYASSMPVHQDGSCNGLQHYAALLRDSHGAAQVNLLPSDEPQDVYAGVRSLVAEKVAADAAAGDPNAQLLDGLITRKVVKQTVMTSVYGVTFIGAKRQIENRLEELPSLCYEEMTVLQQTQLSTYLAKHTLASLGQVFTGATDAMKWLDNAAGAIAKSGRCVAWTMPLGLPVVQPYQRPVMIRVSTCVGNLVLQAEMDDDDPTAKVNPQKQRSAFSPNYIHSLDSAHMMKTAIACRGRGLVFAAVHDSYWTHPGDVDEMNEVLRDKFVELHSGDLLEQLIASFKQDFPDVGWDTDPALALPARGDLDLEKVKESTYFFA